MTSEIKNYGHVFDCLDEARREVDHVALIIVSRDGSTCVNLCPRKGSSDRACAEAVLQTMMKGFLEDEYSRNDFQKLKAIVALQDLTHDAIRKFATDGEDEV